MPLDCSFWILLQAFRDEWHARCRWPKKLGRFILGSLPNRLGFQISELWPAFATYSCISLWWLPPAKVGTWRYMAPEVVRHETWIASFGWWWWWVWWVKLFYIRLLIFQWRYKDDGWWCVAIAGEDLPDFLDSSFLVDRAIRVMRKPSQCQNEWVWVDESAGWIWLSHI